MQAYYATQFVLSLPPGHRFPMAKYAMLRERLAVEIPALRFSQAEPATDGELALAHTPGYIDAVAQGTLTPAQQREIGFPWSPAMVERARRSVGATVSAARTALAEGVSANLAGGTHHAYPDRGSGYCVFNDIAVAARLMQAEWHRGVRAHRHAGAAPAARLLRIAVIDLDVHQGNGTAAIFADDPTVYTLSMHGAKNFPFRKEASDLDVELPDGCTDGPYLDALDRALERLWRDHGDAPPGLAFYLAGADPHEGDRLGRLKITREGLAERDRRVFEALRARRIPVAMSMGGGYGHDLNETVAVQVGSYRAAYDCWKSWRPVAMEQSAP